MASFEVQAPGARQAAMTASPQQAAFRGPGLRVLSRILLSLLVLFAVAARPAMAQSILRDAETEALLQDMMDPLTVAAGMRRSEEHTSELQSLMRISYAVFCLKKKNYINNNAELTYQHNNTN